MAYSDKNLKTDASGIKPVSQHYDSSISDYDPVQGTDGASRVLLWDATGHAPLLTTANPGYVKVTDGTNTQAINTDGSVNAKLIGSNATNATSITPSDTATFTATKGLYLGAAGNVTVTMADGTESLWPNLTAGAIHPISVTAVKQTGTTATGILAVY